MKDNCLRKLFVIFSLAVVSIVLTSSVAAQNMFRKVNDFDGDGRADYAVTRNENGYKFGMSGKALPDLRRFNGDCLPIIHARAITTATAKRILPSIVESERDFSALKYTVLGLTSQTGGVDLQRIFGRSAIRQMPPMHAGLRRRR